MKNVLNIMLPCFAVVIVSCGKTAAPVDVTDIQEEVSVERILLNKEYFEMHAGDGVILNATVEPSEATDKSVSWKSSDEEVAIVSDGMVKAVAPGAVSIEVTAEDGNGACASCQVIVQPEGTVAFEDRAFKNYCAYFCDMVSSAGNKDGEVQYNEAEQVLLIKCSNHNISSLVGIECFVNLDNLFCDMNNLSSLDISKNTELILLNCGDNPLKSIDISNNLNLVFCYCCTDSLTNLDLSHNPELKNLYCWNNQLTNLDLSNNPKLEQLNCWGNRLTNLDLGNNPELEQLNCRGNLLTSLDVSANLDLNLLYCYDNPNLKEIWLRKGQTIIDFRYDGNVTTVKYKD